MKIAVAGCAHGELDKMYEAVKTIESENNMKIDLLICCGDFQAVRNAADLQCMAVPPKYRSMNTFYKYYRGDATAPLLTIFIGGNHEASNYLSELPHGGWVAPNIYYMGLAGVVRLGNLRIAGVSGIYKQQDYLKGHHERLPYDESTLRSVYHVRNLEIFRLKQLTDNIDIFLSHDWPRGIHAFGDQNALFRRKPYFKAEADQNRLGSQPLRDLLDKLTPKYWFAAHMHVKFAALYHNKNKKSEKMTRFLALDKCLPHRQYLQILDMDEGADSSDFPTLKYDPEWLAILKSTDHLLNVENTTTYMPGPTGNSTERYDFRPAVTELSEIDKLFDGTSCFAIPQNFERTAPPYDDTQHRKRKHDSNPVSYVNPQTSKLCEKLGVRNQALLLMHKIGYSISDSTHAVQNMTVATGSEQRKLKTLNLPPTRSNQSDDSTYISSVSKNPDEISLEEFGDAESDALDRDELCFIDKNPSSSFITNDDDFVEPESDSFSNGRNNDICASTAAEVNKEVEGNEQCLIPDRCKQMDKSDSVSKKPSGLTLKRRNVSFYAPAEETDDT